MEIIEKSFTCDKDGFKIRGMQYLPSDFEQNRKYPIVILSHGFLGNYTHMADFGRDFASIGYVACSFSFCGSSLAGQSRQTASDGKSTDMTITTQVQDLAAVKNFILQQTYADAERLVLLGVSQGGFVSGLAAAADPDMVKKLIMIFPALCIPDDARRGRLAGSSYDPNHVPDVIDCGQTLLGKAFHEDVADRDPYQELAAYKGPVLILHGREDELVADTYSIQAQKRYEKGQCCLHQIADMGHGYNEMQRQKLFAYIRQFLSDGEEIR